MPNFYMLNTFVPVLQHVAIFHVFGVSLKQWTRGRNLVALFVAIHITIFLAYVGSFTLCCWNCILKTIKLGKLKWKVCYIQNSLWLYALFFYSLIFLGVKFGNMFTTQNTNQLTFFTLYSNLLPKTYKITIHQFDHIFLWQRMKRHVEPSHHSLKTT